MASVRLTPVAYHGIQNVKFAPKAAEGYAEAFISLPHAKTWALLRCWRTQRYTETTGFCFVCPTIGAIRLSLAALRRSLSWRRPPGMPSKDPMASLAPMWRSIFSVRSITNLSRSERTSALMRSRCGCITWRSARALPTTPRTQEP